MTYLCLSNSYNQKNEAKGNKHQNGNINPILNSAKTNISSADVEFTVEVSCSTVDNPVILPTFTAQIHGTNGESSKVRVFKDGGSQKSFITKSFGRKT